MVIILEKICSSKKAWYFTIDALIFATIIFAAVYYYVPQDPQVPQYANNQFIADDLLGIMGSQKVSDLDTALYTKYSANFTDDDFLVIEQLGQWWADNKITLANEFFEEYINGTVRSEVGLSFHINNEAIYQESSPVPRQLSSAKRIISGVEKEKPIKGVVASARAGKFNKNSTLVYAMPPEGSGWNQGRVFIIKNFTIPSNITITNATVVASIHADTAAADRLMSINNCSINFNSTSWIYDDEGDVGILSVPNSCFVIGGTNRWNVSLNNNGYNAHTHPGTYLTLAYTESDISTFQITTNNISKKYYFDAIQSQVLSGSRAGIWSSMPFYIPREAINVSVGILIKATNVKNYVSGDCTMWCDSYSSCTTFPSWSGNRNIRDNDYIIFLNRNIPFHVDATPARNATYRYNMSNISTLLINGTNLLTFYFNNYQDCTWNNESMNLSPESFIEVNYTLPTTAVPFGHVEITQVQDFGGTPNNDKTANFSFPPEATFIDDGSIYIVQRYSNMVEVWADPTSPPPTRIFQSPAARGVPSEVFLPKERLERLSTVQNYVRVRDSGSGNLVVPISKVIYTFGVPSQVGFGDVFPTAAQAEADAEQRLRDAMGAYVSVTDIDTTTDAITNVPTLWGPAIIEVRTWQ